MRELRGGRRPRHAHWADAEPLLRSWLTDPETLLVGHFVAYDMAVICAEFPALVPLVFAAYDADRIVCVQTRQKLIDIAKDELEFRRIDGKASLRAVWQAEITLTGVEVPEANRLPGEIGRASCRERVYSGV